LKPKGVSREKSVIVSQNLLFKSVVQQFGSILESSIENKTVEVDAQSITVR
jgi:hypothetical protein